ncbi:hypothetical protein OGA32_000095 [Salmonella enterica]|nr:hypothetical protein [Salmonella enterica]
MEEKTVSPEVKIKINRLDSEILLAEASLIQAQLNKMNFLREQDLLSEMRGE